MLSWNDKEVRLFVWYILWLVLVRLIKLMKVIAKAVESSPGRLAWMQRSSCWSCQPHPCSKWTSRQARRCRKEQEHSMKEWKQFERAPTIFSLSVASSIWRITLQRSNNQESNDQIAAKTRWDLYLGQIQKLMKKSTIGDPGMWRRFRTFKQINGALSSVGLFWPPECAARTRLLRRWCRWPKPGTSSPQPGFNMRRKQGMQIERKVWSIPQSGQDGRQRREEQVRRRQQWRELQGDSHPALWQFGAEVGGSQEDSEWWEVGQQRWWGRIHICIGRKCHETNEWVGVVFVQLEVTLKKPMRCPAADDIEPALVFTMRRGQSRMTHYWSIWKELLTVQTGELEGGWDDLITWQSDSKASRRKGRGHECQRPALLGQGPHIPLEGQATRPGMNQSPLPSALL